MSAPSEDAIRVRHFDGISAVPRDPWLVPHGGDFMLVDEIGEEGPFEFARLVSNGTFGIQRQYGMKKRPGWRIEFAGEPPEAIAAMLPGARRYGGVIDRFGLVPAAIAFTVLSAIAVVIVFAAPTAVAALVPRSAERQIGDLMVGDFGVGQCRTREGDAAIKALAARLGADKDVRIRVLPINMVNAITLPGGRIVVFKGLLDEAQSGDEVAGVLGHELGHYEHRDPFEGIVRELGVSAILQGLSGNVGALSRALVDASYSRSVEARADDYAIETLGRAHVSTQATAAFFHRLADDEKAVGANAGVFGYLSSHPISAAREAKFANGDTPGATPALTAEQWKALRTICAGMRPSRLRF